MKERPVIEKKTVKLGKRGRKLLKRLPDLATMFEDEGDPLEAVAYSDNLEQSADSEMSEILRQIKEKRKAQSDIFRVARDPDYFLVLCFQSHDQRNEFLEKSGWAEPDDKYLNGLEICRRLGLDVQPIELKPLKDRGKPKKYSRSEVL